MSLTPPTQRALQALYAVYALYLAFVLYNALTVPWWFLPLLAACAIVCHPAVIVTLFFAVTAPIAMEGAFDWAPPPWLETRAVIVLGLPGLALASAAYSAWRGRWFWHLWRGPRTLAAVRLIYGAVPYAVAGLLLKFAYRDVVIEPVAAGLGCLLALRMHAAGFLGDRAPSVRSELGNAALVLGSTFVALIPAEGLARIAYPAVRSNAELYAAHPEYIFTLAENARTRFEFKVTEEETKEVAWNTSSQGLRDRDFGPKQPGETRILLLGDSFTMGHTVDEEDTIGRLLERRLAEKALLPSPTVINGGMSGAGVWQQWGILRDKGLALEPDWVILQVFMPNDIDNALEIVGKKPRAYNLPWHDYLYGMLLKNTPQVRLHTWLRENSGLYRLIAQAMGRPAPIHRLIGGLWFLPPLPDAGPPSEPRPAHMEDRLEPWYPELDEGFALMTEYILKMRAMCAERNIRFAAYAFPDALDVYPEVWKNNIEHPDAKDYRYAYRKSIRLIEEFFDREGIPYFSLTRRFAAAGGADEVFYMLDGHTTPVGNAAVADGMAAFIAQELRRREPGG